MSPCHTPVPRGAKPEIIFFFLLQDQHTEIIPPYMIASKKENIAEYFWLMYLLIIKLTNIDLDIYIPYRTAIC
jgi:hypothetical protein